MTKSIMLTLPLPPTINHYYGQNPRGKRYIKATGIAFRNEVLRIVAAAGHPVVEGRLSMLVEIFPANRIRQDLDNRAKALQDALTCAGVWLDDEQIDDLHLVRRGVIKGGLVRIVVTQVEEVN